MTTCTQSLRLSRLCPNLRLSASAPSVHARAAAAYRVVHLPILLPRQSERVAQRYHVPVPFLPVRSGCRLSEQLPQLLPPRRRSHDTLQLAATGHGADSKALGVRAEATA